MAGKQWINSKELSGQRFGRLTAVERTELRINCRVVWRSICDCGAEKYKTSSDLLTGNTRSCGCLQKESRIRHGLTGTKVYKNYKEARRRCDIANRTPRWADLDAIRKFYEECPDGHHVDHVIPIKAKKASGLHVLSNLQYLPAAVNVKKQNKFVPHTVQSNH